MLWAVGLPLTHQPYITYIEDICANAKGYATLASGYLKVILERQAGGDK